VCLQVRIHQHDSPPWFVWSDRLRLLRLGYPHWLFVKVIYTVFEKKAKKCYRK